MATKNKTEILIWAICIVIGFSFYPAAGNETSEDLSEVRQKLHQSVREAKKGNIKLLFSLTDSLEEDQSFGVNEELLEDYASFLKDKDGGAQWLGAVGLRAIKSPKGTEALIEYLENESYTALEKNLKLKGRESISKEESYQFICVMRAFIASIIALGEIGDSRAVPVLAKLQKTTNLELEWGFSPVQESLGMLGAVKELVDIPSDADSGLIYRVTRGLKKVNDPNKVPDLKMIVTDQNKPDAIRSATLSALIDINPANISEFIIDIIQDSNYPKQVRSGAAIEAGKIKDSAIEKPLLAHVQNSKSDIRAQAFTGLIISMPERYLDQWFETIMNPNEDLEFRKNLASIMTQTPGRNKLLRNHREKLYNCLNAADQNGRPIDRIRVLTWKLINSLTGEEPSIILTSRDSQAVSSIRHVIRLRIQRDNHSIRYHELQKKVEEEIQRIVNVYDEQKSEEKD